MNAEVPGTPSDIRRGEQAGPTVWTARRPLENGKSPILEISEYQDLNPMTVFTITMLAQILATAATAFTKGGSGREPGMNPEDMLHMIGRGRMFGLLAEEMGRMVLAALIVAIVVTSIT